MLNYIKKKLIGSFSDREIKKYKPILVKINALESEFKPLTQAQSQAKILELRERVANGADLEDVLPETFALVRKPWPPRCRFV